ncbi:hypothetical protein U2150_05730 [Methanothermobacter wolfeii]|uniref:Uncharacterized protein n=1 Tax=Methanothermobacter wolfeii TaxID=145261 RepID=A0A9E7RVA9_METWO|nr:MULTISPECIES: hypothetical protein [Methanothermobacter]NLM03070.1 hypothetical protein [Methanothermobacter wolfeii]QHN05883.1 hypothetical protein FZP57_01530 [Methanothermobacter sp. THM-1]UXH32042.1 hypothetical protein N5910_01720 [Methanothermobacter wolfeii]SCM56104.1 putative protein {ECO:0000313/EMBL:AAB86260,1} [Methanothermobacter wolfeii]
MAVDWIRIKDLGGGEHAYRTGVGGNALDIRVSERKITVTFLIDENPVQRVFLKSNLIYYDYTSEHLRKKYGGE